MINQYDKGRINMPPAFKGYLQLTRPANVVTSVSNILAGFAVASGFSWSVSNQFIIWLALSSACLYAGGVVLNDVFDADIDTIERPERPIPSGRVSLQRATYLGIFLLISGILSAYLVSLYSAFIAFLISIAVLAYNGWTKEKLIEGPLVMGICRALNLLLGISAAGYPVVLKYLPLAFIYLLYILSVTLISKGEVHGSSLKVIRLAIINCFIVAIALGLLFLDPLFDTLNAIPGLILLAIWIIPPLVKVVQDSNADNSRLFVKKGILGIILLDAFIASGYNSISMGLWVLLLLPVSIYLSKLFSVT